MLLGVALFSGCGGVGVATELVELVGRDQVTSDSNSRAEEAKVHE